MLALGHGPLSFPPVLATAREEGLADRIVQAYEAKQYARDGRYVVVGAGIAAINEWVNALDQGAKVISLLRNEIPDEQDLNTPRCFFEALGIDAYQGLSFDDRLEFLGKILKGTAPRRRTWLQKINQARSEGRFDELTGEIDKVEPGPLGLRVHIWSRDVPDLGWFDVTGVVACTGFQKSALTIPLFRRMIQHYGIPVEGGRLKLNSNCGVPGLDMPESRLCVTGIHANGVVPNGDTIAGVKYIGRRFVADCARAEHLKIRPFFSKMGLQLSLSHETSRAIRKVRRTEQLA
jgi:hypothetical protein